MKHTRYSAFWISLLLIIFAGSALHAQNDTIPDQLVLKVISGSDIDSVLAEFQGQVSDSVPGRGLFRIDLSEGAEIAELIEALSWNPNVVFAEPNFSMALPEIYQMSQSFPDENAPPLLEGEQPESFYEQPAYYEIGVDSAQTRSTGAGITVAVIDNGVDFDHPLLSPRFLATGYDFIDHDSDPSYSSGSYFSHGTFVSGLVVLTAPDASVLPVRAFDGNGVGNSFAVADAIYWSVDHGAHVINMSFGTYTNSDAIATACQSAISEGLTLVAASGNDAVSTPSYPAAYAGVIAVSGIDTLEQLASFSNYGDYIDICAPAVNIYSCLAGESYDWGTWSGTSFAAPFVSATAALILMLDPGYDSYAIEMHLRQTAESELLWGTVYPPDPEYGYGLLDAANAVWSINTEAAILSGDMNNNGYVEVGDAVHLMSYIFRNGAPPDPQANPDLNCDGSVNVADVQFILDFIFHGGAAPDYCP